MKRREFIKNMGLLAGAGTAYLTIGNSIVKAFSNPLFNFNNANGNILVLLQLKGGNDGLNMVIPIENSVYYTKRPTIAIPKTSALQLTSQIGLHPSLTKLRDLYNQGRLTIVSSVGYPSQNRSHFRSTDIWMTASDSNQFLYDGWGGRYLLKEYPTYPEVFPAHPMAIEIGSAESLLFSTPLGGTSIAFQDPNTFYQLVSGSSLDSDPPPDTRAGDELKFLKQVAAQSIQYATVIKQKADAMPNKVIYPSNSLSSQLKIVAQLIGGGLETSVYLTSLSGFDTHSNELATLTRLYGYISDAVDAFYRDISAMGKAGKVVIVTFSEFGRRLTENGSSGTDHGAAAPMMIIGENINGGIIGGAPNLTDLDSSGDVKYVYDFRQIYSAIMKDHLGLPQTSIDQVLLRNFQPVPIFRSTTGTERPAQTPKSFELFQNYPNPFNPSTVIKYSVPEMETGNGYSMQHTSLKIYDLLGREIAELVNEAKTPGTYSVQFNANGLPSGTYIYTLKTGNMVKSKKMTLVK